VIRGLVPQEILTRKKMGFPVPFSGWVRGPWNAVARDVLLDRRTCQRGVINPAAVEVLLDEHRSGRRAGGDAIWALINLELWYRTFIDGDGIQTLPGASRLKPAPTASEPAGTASEPGRTASEPAGTACEPGRTASEPAGTASQYVGAGFSRPATNDSHQPTAAA
jgi:hypothetical protein